MGRKQLDKHRVATLLGVRQQSAPQPGHLGSAEGALVTHSAADGNHSRQLMLFFFAEMETRRQRSVARKPVAAPGSPTTAVT